MIILPRIISIALWKKKRNGGTDYISRGEDDSPKTYHKFKK